MVVRILKESEEIVDVTQYNEKIKQLYSKILSKAPIEPDSARLSGENSKYLGSDQSQVVRIELRWTPDTVDGGFQINIGINSLGNISKEITKPPKVESKIYTFMNCKNYRSFKDASQKLLSLFKYADEIREEADSIF